MSAPTIVEWAQACQRVLVAILGDEAVPLAELEADLVTIATKSRDVHRVADALSGPDVAAMVSAHVAVLDEAAITVVSTVMWPERPA